MKTQILSAVEHRRSAWLRAFGALAVAAGAFAVSGAVTQAQARDNIHWSIGINSPGVSVGVGNAPTVVYGYPQPVYQSYGYPVYSPAPVVVYPRTVVVHPRPVVVHRYESYGYGYDHGYDRGPRHWKHHKHGGHGHKYRHRGHRGWDRD